MRISKSFCLCFNYLKAMLLVAVMMLFSSSQLYAGEEYRENMDSLLHQVKEHRQGVVIFDEEGVKLKVYLSFDDIASNGKHYYRWWTGNFLHSFFPEDLSPYNDVEALPYGYRFDDEKMYVYNYLTEEESLAYDFTLQPGEQFTTPNGICWKVVGRRTEVFESAYDHYPDYRNEHVVLSLQSLDGTMTDEWVQYIGSLHYPIQTWGRKDVKLSRTAFFNFGACDDKLVYFDFAEDPLYGQYVDVEPGPYAHTELTRDYSVIVGKDSLNIAINYYTWFTRHYCYTYRNGNTLDIKSVELGPYLDGGTGSPSFGLTFSGAPSYDNYTIVYNGEMLHTSIGMPQETKAINPFYDLSGRPLSTPPAKGVFIQDGQKVMR